MTWAKDRVDGIVWDFVNQNRNHLEHEGDFEPNKVYPSRRSWHRFDECLAGSSLMTEESFKENTGTIYHLASSFVGFEAAVAFNDFVQNYERQVTIEMLLDEGKIDATKNFGINDHNALVEKMEAANTFEDELEEGQVTNLAAYFIALPSEVAMKLWTGIGQGHNSNVISLHQSTVDGQSVSSYLVELMTGNSTS